MNRLEREEFVQSPYIALWSLLGFQSGYINAFGFLACGRYVSHVTGFGTQIGMALASNNVAFALELFGFPLFFILGAFLSGLVTSARIERGLHPRFDVVTAFVPCVILSLLALGELGLFGPFEEQLVQARDFALLFLLSLVCGMQNGCFAVLTKGHIRTTHLTGISTDIGTDLARIYWGKLSKNELALTRRINFSRAATFISFSLGSIVSVIASSRLGYSSLVVPFVSSLVVFLGVRWVGKLLKNRRVAENALVSQGLGSSIET